MIAQRIAIAIALCAGVASAQPVNKPDAATIKKASSHFKLGQEFFTSSQWDRALAEYQAAFDLTGEPLMIFNIALTHDRAGRPEQALEAYRRYLESGLEGPIANEARGYVARLTPIVDQLNAERAEAEARKAADAEKARALAEHQAELARQEELAKRGRAERASRAEAIERRGKRQQWLGIGVAGVGLLATGYGVKVGLDASSIADEMEAHEGAWTDAQIARDAEGRSLGRRMVIASVLGGAMIIGGGVLYVVGRGVRARAEALRVGVLPAPGGVTAALSFAF